MANNSAVRKRKTRNNSTNNKGSKKAKVSKKKSKSKKSNKLSRKNSSKRNTLTSEDKQKLINSMNEFQTTLVKITKNFETINVILGKIV